MKIKKVKFFGEKDGVEIYEIEERKVDLAEYLAILPPFYNVGTGFEEMINTFIYPTTIIWNKKRIRKKFLYFFRDIDNIVKFIHQYLAEDKKAPFEFLKNLDSYRKNGIYSILTLRKEFEIYFLKKERVRRRFSGRRRVRWGVFRKKKAKRDIFSTLFPAFSMDETPEPNEMNFSFPPHPFIITTNKNYSICVIENSIDRLGIFFWDGRNKIFKNFSKRSISKQKLESIIGEERYYELSKFGEIDSDFNFVRIFLLPYELQAVYKLKIEEKEFNYPYEKKPEYIPQGLIFAPHYVPVKDVKKAKLIRSKKEKAWIIRRISKGVYHPDFYEKEHELEKGVYCLCKLT